MHTQKLVYLDRPHILSIPFDCSYSWEPIPWDSPEISADDRLQHEHLQSLHRKVYLAFVVMPIVSTKTGLALSDFPFLCKSGFLCLSQRSLKTLSTGSDSWKLRSSAWENPKSVGVWSCTAPPAIVSLASNALSRVSLQRSTRSATGSRSRAVPGLRNGYRSITLHILTIRFWLILCWLVKKHEQQC